MGSGYQYRCYSCSVTPVTMPGDVCPVCKAEEARARRDKERSEKEDRRHRERMEQERRRVEQEDRKHRERMEQEDRKHRDMDRRERPRCQEHPTQCRFGDPKARRVKRFINAYDSELAYTDVYLSDVFKTLKELQLDQNTIVVITSDHGESFEDRKPNYLFHGRSVYNEELHVPLIIKTPQSKAQRRSDIVGFLHSFSSLFSMIYGKSV